MLKKILLWFLATTILCYSIDPKEFVPFEELDQLEIGKKIKELSIFNYIYSDRFKINLEITNYDVLDIYVFKVLLDVDKEPNLLVNLILYSSVGLLYGIVFFLSAWAGTSSPLGKFPNLTTYHDKYVYDYFILVFKSDTLFYGGFQDNYRKSTDSIINLIGKKIDYLM